MEKPVFIEANGETIISEMVAFYEGLTGRTLQPAQAERLLINAFAYRELMVREQIQAVGEQMLVAFASAPALDYLAELVGVVRLAASSASTVVEFTLVDGHTGVVIPAGLRIGSTDGKAVFIVPENITVEAGETSAESNVFCERLATATSWELFRKSWTRKRFWFRLPTLPKQRAGRMPKAMMNFGFG
jgi:hypothetical protein